MIVFFSLGCLQPQSSNTGSETNIESRPTNVTNTEDTSSDVTEDNNEPEPIYLSEGIWAFSNLTLTGQTCGFPNETIEQLIEDLGVLRYDVQRLIEENYTFTLLLEDGTGLTNTCTAESSVYSCADFVIPIPVRDSTITETYTISGTIEPLTH